MKNKPEETEHHKFLFSVILPKSKSDKNYLGSAEHEKDLQTLERLEKSHKFREQLADTLAKAVRELNTCIRFEDLVRRDNGWLSFRAGMLGFEIKEDPYHGSDRWQARKFNFGKTRNKARSEITKFNLSRDLALEQINTWYDETFGYYIDGY